MVAACCCGGDQHVGGVSREVILRAAGRRLRRAPRIAALVDVLSEATATAEASAGSDRAGGGVWAC